MKIFIKRVFRNKDSSKGEFTRTNYITLTDKQKETLLPPVDKETKETYDVLVKEIWNED